MPTPSTEFYRLDPLSGCHNFLSFVETLANMSSTEQNQQFSILYTDLNYMQDLNESRGHTYGDSVIRWLGIVLQEESELPTYRIGGDEFSVILVNRTPAEYEELLHRVFGRLNREGEQLGIPAPVAKIALIHYPMNDHFTINDVMFHLWEAILDIKRYKDSSISQYMAHDLLGSRKRPGESNGQVDERSQETLRWIANQAVYRVLSMGRVLDAAQKESLQDSISGLPNMRAALRKLEQGISSNQSFSILLMDGDELKRYNNISYAAGDEMIQKIGAILSEKLRPGDFLARWRTGDEFIAILPNTSREGARLVGERFCTAVRGASSAWRFPTSITIGIAVFPAQGTSVQELVDSAERAMQKGKEAGKDQVVVAG